MIRKDVLSADINRPMYATLSAVKQQIQKKKKIFLKSANNPPNMCKWLAELGVEESKMSNFTKS